MKIAESILNALDEPVLVLDVSLRAIVANPAFYKTLMIAPDLLEGKGIQELVAEDGDAQHLRAMLEAVAAHESDVEHLQIECVVPPSSRKKLSLTARRVSVGEEQTELLLVELRDITRQEEAERRILDLNTALQLHAIELEAINLDLESFTHSAAHDLRTPLRLTNKIAHLLIQEHGKEFSSGVSEKLEMILQSTQEMGKLIEDLLAFSQVRHEPLKKRPVGMRRLAHEAKGELVVEEKGRKVKVQVEDLPPCIGDRALLKQVFLNLLSNALKFTRECEKTEIRVGSLQSNGEAVYFVRDNGVGFEEKYARIVFLPFRRLHRNKDYEGTGIGLALVKRVIECHGGSIWPESQVDRGTTIYFTVGEQPAGVELAQDRIQAT